MEAVIGPAPQLVVFDEDRWRLAQRIEELTPPDSWLQAAAVSLVQDPLCVDSSGWVNGQHRGQATIDGGARRVLVEIC